jgi:hypothetical protein
MSALLAVLLAAQAPAEAEPLARVVVPFAAAAHLLVDVDGRPGAELLVIGQGGEVRTWRHAPPAEEPGEEAAWLAGPIGALVLEDPRHTLVDSAPLLGPGAGEQLLTAAPAGLSAVVFGPDAAPLGEPRRLARRARFDLRVGVPTRARIVQDVNADGRPDVVLPGPERCELWLNAPPDLSAEPPLESTGAAALPSFRQAATIRVEVERGGNHFGDDLSEVLESSFAIPSLVTRDVNGDGRPDLLVSDGPRRAFHLQAEDGSFPPEPDVACDLAIFRDTVEAAQIAPGQTLAVDDTATYESEDLDLDGVPDYVIAHRRKVWVFFGSRAGPQFREPAQILKSAEDVTALTLVDLDEDQRPDLLLVKVQVPTIATLVRGIFGEWDIEVGAAGFKNLGDRRFETSPSKKGGAVVRLPSILAILRRPEDLLERFEQVEGRFRESVQGDFDGDGAMDVGLLSEDRTNMEVWLGAPGQGSLEIEGRRILRELLFEDANKIWDVDRLVQGLGSLADRQVAGLTGGRPPDATLALRAEGRLVIAMAADLDGDGRDELVVRYAVDARTELDVLRVDARR